MAARQAVVVLALLAGTAIGQSQDWRSSATRDPITFFTLLSQMPLAEQKLYLKLAGARLQEQTGSQCNVFGSECQSLPADSAFAHQCPDHDLQVDCAYYAEDMADEVQQSPADVLREKLARLGYSGLEKACPQCFQNQLAIWCAQTVPKCGSFSAAVEGAILPAIATVTQAQQNGRPPLEALAEAVPQLMAATDLSLPCSQMCEAVVSSCGCKDEQRFGKLLEAYLASSNAKVPAGFTSQIFGSLWDRPICSLYGNTSAPGFAGHCDVLPATCTDEAKWCKAQQADSAGAEVQELMAAQLAFALFGWLDAPASSLFQDAASAVSSADDKDAKQLESKYLVQGSDSRQGGSSAWATVAHVLAVVVVVAALGGLAFFIVRKRRQDSSAASGYAAIADDTESFLPPESR